VLLVGLFLSALWATACGPTANGGLGAFCRCSPADNNCTLQASGCDTGLRCSGTPLMGGVCVPVDAGF
jgi:hypothetical protein